MKQTNKSHFQITFLFFFRTGKSRSSQKGYPIDAQRRKVSIPPDDNHTICDASCRSHAQKVAAYFLGNRAQKHARRKANAGNDFGLRRL